ncbi:MAG: ATP-binding protein [Bacteroidia bacterium]|nr:ATP-binding protein [Bacteroidia bacterium]
MDLRQLENIIKAGEGLQLEFKRRVPEWDKLMREFVALANAKGGMILVGVDDDGSLVGVKDGRECEFEIHAAVQKHCRPLPDYSLEIIPISRKRQIVVATLAESNAKPVLLVEDPANEKGVALFRVEDRSIRASRELFYILKHSQNDDVGVKFEFGDKEKKLMTYLESHPTITLREFAEIAGIKTFIASRTLVMLVRANVLRIHPHEKEDHFSLVE